MAETQLPGVFGEQQPLLEHYGYLAVGGFVLLEDFGVPVPGETMLIAAAVFAGENIVEIYAAFERYRWFVIAAIAVVAVVVITRRVRRRRPAARA